MKLTSVKLLQTMDSGREYQAGELAWRFDRSTTQINDMPCTLVEEKGLARVSNHSSRIHLERLSFAIQSSSPVIADAGIQINCSDAPVTHHMHGSLLGYDASLRSVRNLAMLARHSW